MTGFLLALGGLLLATLPAAAVEFDEPRQIRERQAIDSAAFGTRTLVRTPDALYLVDWSQPRGGRDTLVRHANLATWGARASFIALADTLVAMAPENQGPHFLVHAAPDGTPVVDLVPDPAWKAANCWLQGLPYLADLAGDGVRLAAALGGSHDDLDLACGFELQARQRRLGGDRFVGLDEDHLGRGGGAFQLWDLSDPQAPRRGPVVGRDYPVTDAWIDGRVMYLAAGTLEAWDIGDVEAPVLLDVLGPAADRRGLTRGAAGRLACWEGLSFIRIVDVRDPTDLAYWKSYVPTGAAPFRLGGLDVESGRVVVQERGSLRALVLPTAGGGAVTDGGLAWPRLGDGRDAGTLFATDGVRAWFQGEGRLVADLAARTLTPVVEPVLPLPARAGSTPRFLRHHRGHLVHALGDGRVVVEDVGDPLRAETAFVFPEGTSVHDAVMGDGLLALRAGWTIYLFGMDDPAAPRMHGAFTVEPCDALAMAVGNGLLAIARGVRYVGTEVTLRAAAAGGACPVVGDVVLGGTNPTVAAFLGAKLYVYDGSIAYGGAYEYRLDVSDPAAPTLAGWRSVPAYTTVAGTGHLDAGGAVYLPSLGYGELLLHRYAGVLPPADPPLAALPLHDLYNLVGTAGDRVILVRAGEVLSYRVAGLGIAAADAPAAPGAVAVRPNPFNARAIIAFTQATAGPVRVELFDARGRRVRTLAASLPAGPATLAWDGRDGAGRDLASGVYLVRVQGAGAPPVTGRCALVR